MARACPPLRGTASACLVLILYIAVPQSATKKSVSPSFLDDSTKPETELRSFPVKNAEEAPRFFQQTTPLFCRQRRKSAPKNKTGRTPPHVPGLYSIRLLYPPRRHQGPAVSLCGHRPPLPSPGGPCAVPAIPSGRRPSPAFGPVLSPAP